MLAMYSDSGLPDKLWMKRMYYNCIPQLGNYSRKKKTTTSESLWDKHQCFTENLFQSILVYHHCSTTAPQKRPHKTAISLLSSKNFKLPMAFSKHLVFCQLFLFFQELRQLLTCLI